MNETQIITTTYGFPPEGAEVFMPGSEKKALAAASREASEREMAYINFLNRTNAAAGTKTPALREPVLPIDFVRCIDTLDERLCANGIAVLREQLVSLGRERFQELLATDRSARSLQRVVRSHTDFTSWPSVKYAFAAANALVTQVPRRKIAEQAAGAGVDRDEASKIGGFPDLWKVSSEQATTANVYAFHDLFVRLLFGMSLLERLSPDGRLRNFFFAGGKGEKGDYFRDWLSVLDGPHFTVAVVDPLGLVFAWLCGEKTALPKPAELTNKWLGVRVPSTKDIWLVQAVWHGFLLGYSSWALWDYVGRAIRKATDVELLETWRKELAKRYPAITAFHDVLSGYFCKDVQSGKGAYRQFDDTGYRAFIDHAARKLSRCLSALMALALEEVLPGTIVARFSGWVLCEVNSEKAKNFPKNFLPEFVMDRLEAAFPGQRFYFNQFKVEELAP